MPRLALLIGCLLLVGCVEAPPAPPKTMVHLFTSSTCERIVADQFVRCKPVDTGKVDCGTIDEEQLAALEREQYSCTKETVMTPEEFTFRMDHEPGFRQTYDSYEFR